MSKLLPNMSEISSRRWTWIGLAISLLAIPLVLALFDLGREYLEFRDALFRESTLFFCAGVLLFIIRKKERLDWHAVGLGRPQLGRTVIWTLIACIAIIFADMCAASMSASFAGSGYRRFESFGGWVLWLMLLRGVVIEELFYRGYSIIALRSLTGSRLISISLPLLAYAGAHFREGWDGMVSALLVGLLLTGVFLVTRNLWITMAARFLMEPYVLTSVVPIIVSCAITLAGGDGITVSPRSVILKEKHGPKLVKQCMQNSVQDAKEFWTPSLADLQEMEKRLPSFIAEKTQLGRSIAEDYKQYVGVVSKGKRLIFVSAFHLHEYDQREKLGWKHKPIVFCGGASDFWQVEYDPETKKFMDFQINGPL